jgi:eukaryotic-like serine/threonine-protein kinase
MSDGWYTTDPVGETIAGRYELLQVVARGGHGLVWRARDNRTGETVALKMLTDVAAQDPELVERLRREQLMLKELAGTDAVQVRDLCASASGKLCLVMELLDGIDLEQCLASLEQNQQPMPIVELVRLLSPIVTTLEHAHARGIVHRDLKPANIFLVAMRAGGGVRLLDFGLARMRSSSPLTAAGSIMGSPSYIAPEVWQGRPERLDRRVDVYSLGIIIFRALTGRLPFGGQSLQEKFLQATTAARPSLVALRPDMPADMDAWVAQVLAIDPESRFNSVRAAWNALLGVLRIPPPPEPERPVPSSRIVAVEAGDQPFSALPGAVPERSLVTEWLAHADLHVEPSLEDGPAAARSREPTRRAKPAPSKKKHVKAPKAAKPPGKAKKAKPAKPSGKAKAPDRGKSKRKAKRGKR